jgi:hypothetical protein
MSEDSEMIRKLRADLDRLSAQVLKLSMGQVVADHSIMRADGTTGRVVQGSGATLDDNGRLELLGTGTGAWPASSGTADANVVLRVHTSSVGLDFGTHNSGMSWLQNRLVGNLATNFAIILNPVGGGAGVGLYGVPVHANNDAAVAAGMMAGMFYRTGGNPDYLCIVH